MDKQQKVENFVRLARGLLVKASDVLCEVNDERVAEYSSRPHGDCYLPPEPDPLVYDIGDVVALLDRRILFELVAGGSGAHHPTHHSSALQK